MAPVPTYRKLPISRHGRPAGKPRKKLTGLSPRVKKALSFMVFGTEEEGIPLSRKEAAKAAGFSDETLRQALRNPVVVAHYNEIVTTLRTSERAKSLHRIVKLRDDADSEQVQLRAARFLYGEDQGQRSGVNVNIGVAVTPGYVIDLRPIDQAERAKQISHLVNIDPKDVSHFTPEANPAPIEGDAVEG